MSVAAAGRIAARIRRVRTEIPGPMHVIAVLFDVVVNVRVNRFAFALFVTPRLLRADCEMLATLPLKPRAVNHMPEMRNHAHLCPKLSRLIEVNSPRIAAALRENLEHMPRGMIT